MTRATTNYSLWYQDISCSVGDLEPSRRVRVKEIICRYPGHKPPLLAQSFTQNSVNLISALTRCERIDTVTDNDTDVVILFKTSPSRGSQSAEGARKRVADPMSVTVGCEVLLWHSWVEIQIPLRTENDSTESLQTALLCSRFMVK